MIHDVGVAGVLMVLALIGAHHGPFPWLRNVRFEPFVFVATMYGALYILGRI